MVNLRATMSEKTPIALQTRTQVKGKQLINSFLLANCCDALLTGLALQLPGFVERGLVAREMLAQARGLELLILKIAITAFMIGIYALAAERHTRWRFSVEAALRVGITLVWLAVAWNEINLVLALSEMLNVKTPL